MNIQREKLVQALKQQGIKEPILNSFSKVKRENFVPDQFMVYAYEDISLPLDEGSALSQPSTIAFILELLELKQNQKVLEIGSGSGYVLSLISEIIKTGKIYGLEINQKIALKSRRLLERDSNIEIFNRSGLQGFNEKAPFDRILVSAGFQSKDIPRQIALQLADQGILVAPIKTSIIQIKKENNSLTEIEFSGFSFVPFKEE